MKFLFYSPHGDSAGIAYRVKQEGNQCWMYIPEEFAQNTLEGIVPKVKKVSEGLSYNPDVIFFDMVGYGKDAIRLKKLGYKVVGSGSVFKGRSFQDDLELERDFGMQAMKTANISIPETTTFKGSELDKAEEQVKKTKDRYVMKPNGNKNPYTTYVSESWQDMVDHIEYIKKKKLMRDNDYFILQKFVEGIEISTEQWFSNGIPIYPANGTIETKKFLVGNLGPNTGCQSSLVWFYERKEPKILQLTLKKLHLLLKTVEYTGPLDINCVISKEDKKPNGIEWTARPGYSAIYALINLLTKDIGEHLYLISRGELDEFYFKKGFAYSVRSSIPPFPLCISDSDLAHKLMRQTEGHKVTFEGKKECFFPLDIKNSDDGKSMVTAGIDGVIAEIVGQGDTVEQAKNEANVQLNKLKFPDKQARLDGWRTPLNHIPLLKEWGYDGIPSVEEVKKEEIRNGNKLSYVA